jgi:putative DNA methylase
VNAPIKRKLIEVALPLEAINVASAREKSIRHGHPSTLHLWWARRPLAACRAVLFASLVDDPSSDPDRFPTPAAVEEERTRLFGIIERLVLWENTTNEEVLEEARAEIRRSTGGSPPPVLDPFCGGGSIPLEAQRLGLTSYASDLNPVAVLITKAMIEIPPKFANRPPVHPDARRGIGASGTWKGAAGLAEDVRRYGTWMRDEAARRIGHLYPKVRLTTEQGGGEATVIAWIWARTVTCPNPACRAQMPLVRSFALSTKPGRQAWVVPAVDRAAKTVSFEVHTGPGTPPDPPKIGRGAMFRCLVCEQVAPDEHIKAEGRAKRMNAQLMAIIAEGVRGRLFVGPNKDHVHTAESARPEWGPEQEIGNDPRALWTVNYGLTRFRDLFTPRQLVALTTFSDLVGEARARAVEDGVAAGLVQDDRPLNSGGSGAPAYADALATYLAFVVDRSANYWSSLTPWGGDFIVQTFGRQAIPMVWDFAEANGFSDSTGSWSGAVTWVSKAIETVPAWPPAEAAQADAMQVTSAVPAMVCTDPPYYDNIGYADLSDYFYVWLRRSLQPVFPDLFSTLLTPKVEELVASPYRFGGDKKAAERHFESGLGKAFARAMDISPPGLPITFFYAFKQAESGEDSDAGGIGSTGWSTMLEGLLTSGFAIDGTWPLRTERDQGLKTGTNVLASSVLLVCRPRALDAGITTRKEFVLALRRELPEALRTLQHGNIAPVDLTQASIGPGMAVFSRYAKVLEPDGTAMSVRRALSLINQALDEVLSEQEGEFDADTRWAIAWYDQYGLQEGPYGSAETMSRAKNTSIGGLVAAGIVKAQRGKVRLLARGEYSPDWDPAKDSRVPVWEAMQRLVHGLLIAGEGAAGAMLSRIGGLGDEARDLAYRMYQVANHKGWTDEARAYNALVVEWPNLVRGAREARSVRSAQASLGLDA